MSIAAVVVSFYSGEILHETLDKLIQDPSINSIWLVNNGNPEIDEARLRQLHRDGKIHLLEGQGNIGFARACNLAAEQVLEDVLLLLNPDCQPIGNAIAVMHKALKECVNAEAVLLGGKVVDEKGQEQRGSRRRLLTPRTAFAEMLPIFFGKKRRSSSAYGGRSCRLLSGTCRKRCLHDDFNRFFPQAGRI